MRSPVIAFCSACVCSVMLLAPPVAVAQYKYIDANGKTVTYSDLPPPANARILAQKNTPATSAPSTALPYDLQQSVQKFPVILYSAPTCSSCDEGRNYLVNRGIPFAEKTVKSNEDIDTLKRISPEATVPVLMVGRIKGIGFASASWGALLDTAGYPSASKLPADYQYAPAEAAAPTAAETLKADSQGSAPDAGNRIVPATPPPPPLNAPPGFKF